MDEEFDEARYFTREFDKEMVKKLRFNRASSSKKIVSIIVKDNW